MNETVKALLGAPQITQVSQGVDTYPRVIRQDDRADGAMLVTFALPGLRRAKAWIPETAWINGDHLSMHAAMMRTLDRCTPKIVHDPDDELVPLQWPEP